jgi:ribosomal protein L7Ae-like RNA K-turn-binding protein
MDNIKNYILFPSYNYGMKLESALKKEKIKFTIVPTPRELSASCGISIEYKKEDEEKIKTIVEENAIKIAGFYSIEKTYTNFYK